ncbi:MAG TPA: hypothetical protein VJ734_02100 [Nitrosospira sp.]|nr:hypothetical protein [Nitrosospira sp.]
MTKIRAMETNRRSSGSESIMMSIVHGKSSIGPIARFSRLLASRPD